MEYGFVNYKKSFNARKITKKVIIVDFQGIITDYHYKMFFPDFVIASPNKNKSSNIPQGECDI